MKLPWDRKYLKISLHVIVTVVCIYALMHIIDFLAYIIFDIGSVLVSVFAFIGSILAVFQPLFLALFIAYLLDPLVEFFQHLHEKKISNWFKDKKIKVKPLKFSPFKNKERIFKTRIAGATFSYISILVFLYAIIHLLALNLGGADNRLIQLTEVTIANLQIIIHNIEEMLYILDLDFLQVVFEQVAGLFYGIQYILIDVVNNALTTVAAAGALVLNFFISLVVAFYVLVHKEFLKSYVRYLSDLFLPKILVKKSIRIMDMVNTIFSGYMRGLILDGIILGSLIGVALTIIGVELAILIGVLTAVFNLIPYFGGIMAFVVSIVSELILGSPTNALWAAVVIIIIQQIDTIFIVPRVVGKKVSLSAPVVILSLSVGGTLFGIIGMFLAVPVVAILKIIVSRFIERYDKIKNLENNNGEDI